MKKLALGLSMLLLVMGCGQKEEKIKIGITQIIEHSALDDVAVGFQAALKDGGYGEDKVVIDYQNAQGDFGTAQTIASSFVQDKKDIVLAISTPSAQAMYNASKEIPIVISAVTDANAAGLTGDNITGTSDMSPIDQQVSLIKELLPSAKTIGVVYNTSEENSLVLVDKLKEVSNKYGYAVTEKGITNINEIGQALDVILKEVDVLYTPTDNLVTAATPLVMAKAKENQIPVIACIDDQVRQGALATETINYKDLGYQSGKIAIRILKGENAKDIPIEMSEKTVLMINKNTANDLGIEIPADLAKRATIVE